MRRVGTFWMMLAALLSFDVPGGGAQTQPSTPTATCEASSIDPESYKLATEAQAQNVIRPRGRWWEPYGIWQTASEIGDINEGAVALAERARELDQRNLLAHGYLARQYVTMAVDANKAEDVWRRTLDNGGAVVWTASLHQVDSRSFFVLAFDPQGLRIFRFSQLAGEVRTQMGVPEFPTVDRLEFWRALGGCLPSTVKEETRIPWSSVGEVRASPLTLRFDLRDRVTITSDRGKRRTDDAVEVNLHPHAGDLDYRFTMMPFVRHPFAQHSGAVGAGAYHQRVKQMLETFFDPLRRQKS